MKNIIKVPEFLKKAVRALRGEASVLKARLLFLASLRRRTAMVGALSNHTRALMSGQEENAAAVDNRGKALAPAEDVDEDEQPAPTGPHDVVGLSELASLFQEVDDDDGRGSGYPDWTHSLFDDDGINGDNHHDDDERLVGEVVEEELDDEPSVIDVIRSRREGDGVEFNIEEEIDHAADMFIRRVRGRMNNRSF